MSKKLHWFSLTFIDGVGVRASVYRGVEVEQGKRLKLSDLNMAKESAGVSKNAVLICSAYMGCGQGKSLRMVVK